MRRVLAVAGIAVVGAVPATAGATAGPDIAFTAFPNASRTDVVVLDDAGTPVANVTGSEDQNNLFSLQIPRSPSWSPDGTRLAYVGFHLVERPTGGNFVGGEIQVARADGSDVHRLTDDAGQGDTTNTLPSWSPDGSTIAWVKAGSQGSVLWAMRPDGSDQHEVARLTGTPLAAPAWSPDSTRLLTTTGTSFALEIVVVARAGGQPVSLTPAGASDSAPQWSPDGSRIAFVANTPLGQRVAVMSADGSGRHVVSATPGNEPSWAPDGSRIAFTGSRSFPELASRFGPPSRTDVFVVGADGSDERRLTGPVGPEFGTVRGGNAPTWWPNGSRLFFVSVGSLLGGATTWSMNADGSCEALFAPDSSAPILLPVWSPVASISTSPAHCADLRVAGTLATDAALGGSVDGSVTIDNDGDLAATGLRIALTGPPGGRIEDVSSGCAAGTAITCELPSLAAQSRTTVSFRVHVPARSGPATTSIVVGATEPDPDPTTNTLVLRTSVLPCTIVGTSGADWLRGTPEPDRICGLPGSDRLLGLAGDDYLDAGNGDDDIVGGPGRDTIVARGGRDLIRARDGQRDRIDCGSERDIVLADRFDQLLGGCDYVLTNGLRCTKFGTGGGDTLTGTSRRDVICALPGNDTVRGGAGDDALDGGNGNDTLDGGPGRDLVLGGPGFDTISSRDGARDRIRCGTGDDLVLADRRDDVASDCELLRRG